MASYFYAKTLPAGSDTSVLLGLLQAAGLPVTDVQTSGAFPGQVIVVTSRDLTQPEQDSAAAVVTAWDPRLRRRRLLLDVFNDIGALTGPQQLAIATDLFGGVPPKFTSDAGEDSADLLVLYCLSQTGLSTADKNLVKRSAAAIYTRDNPLYLTHPSFDPTILVAGDEPVP